jgi:hypothetical protein
MYGHHLHPLGAGRSHGSSLLVSDVVELEIEEDLAASLRYHAYGIGTVSGKQGGSDLEEIGPAGGLADHLRRVSGTVEVQSNY